jgi:hypothetical protein
VDPEDFHDQLRLYKRHVVFFWSGAALAVLGFAAASVLRHTALTPAAIAFVSSGFMAYKGNKAANLFAPRQQWTTRRYEDMSPTERVTHARVMALKLVLLAATLVAVDVWSASAHYGRLPLGIEE